MRDSLNLSSSLKTSKQKTDGLVFVPVNYVSAKRTASNKKTKVSFIKASTQSELCV